MKVIMILLFDPVLRGRLFNEEEHFTALVHVAVWSN